MNYRLLLVHSQTISSCSKKLYPGVMSHLNGHPSIRDIVLSEGLIFAYQFPHRIRKNNDEKGRLHCSVLYVKLNTLSTHYLVVLPLTTLPHFLEPDITLTLII